MAVGGDDKNLYASKMTYFLPDLRTIIINIFSLHSGISPICYYLWLRQMDASLSPGSLPPSPLSLQPVLGGLENPRWRGKGSRGLDARPRKSHEHVHEGQRPRWGKGVRLRTQRLPLIWGFHWKTLGFPRL